MDEKLSALLDDELDQEAASDCLDRLSRHISARQAWSRQNLIRAVLKDQAGRETVDISAQVMVALRNESISDSSTGRARVLPFRLPGIPRQQWATGLAVAASIAAVTMLLPVFDTPDSVPAASTSQVAQSTDSQAIRQVALERARANAEARRELQQYLLDHEAIASGHGLSSQRAYMRMASPGAAYVTYSPEQ